MGFSLKYDYNTADIQTVLNTEIKKNPKTTEQGIPENALREFEAYGRRYSNLTIADFSSQFDVLGIFWSPMLRCNSCVYTYSTVDFTV